jgi:hypothetical protein
MRYQHGVDIYLYTHWGGAELPLTLQSALRRRQRWDDDAYLARIIFCEMVKGDEAGETGFGIAPHPQDNQHDWLVVDAANQRVERHEYDGRELSCEQLGNIVKSWTFEEFCSDMAVARGEAW